MPRASRPLSRTPTGVNFDSNAQTMAQAREAWNTVADLLASIGDTAAPVTIRIDGGQLDPTNAVIRVQVDDVVDPEDPSADGATVATILTTNIANGRTLYLSIHDNAVPITFRHLFGGGAGIGELELSGGVDVMLTSRNEWLVLQRDGNRFIERRPKAAPLTSFDTDIVGGGRAITDLRLKWVTVKAFESGQTGDDVTRYMTSGGVYTVTTSDRGCLLYFEAPGTLNLPNTLGSWRRGDMIYWAQGAGNLFVTTGGQLVNPFSHDRGAGIGSIGSIMLTSSSTPMTWWLSGATTSVTGGGGGGGGGTPTMITRSWGQNSLTTTPQTTSGQATNTYTPAVTFAHTPGSNERWLYIARGTLKYTADSAADTRFRLRNNATDPGALALIPAANGAPRFATHTDSAHLMLLQLYGATPGTQTILAEMAPGATTAQASWVRPGIVGLRLEADEFAFQAAQAAAVTTTTGAHATYVTALTESVTLLADDYLIIAWCGWDGAALQGAKIKLTVGGVTYSEKNMGKNFSTRGWWNALKVVTGTGVATTITIDVASRVNASQASVYDVNLVILKKSRFEEWYVGDGETETAANTSATTYNTAATVSATLTANRHYLVLADFTAKNSVGDDSATGVNVRLDCNDVTIHDMASYGTQTTGALQGHGPQGYSNIRVKSLATDVYTLKFAPMRANDSATLSHSTIVILSLAPTP